MAAKRVAKKKSKTRSKSTPAPCNALVVTENESPARTAVAPAKPRARATKKKAKRKAKPTPAPGEALGQDVPIPGAPARTAKKRVRRKAKPVRTPFDTRDESRDKSTEETPTRASLVRPKPRAKRRFAWSAGLFALLLAGGAYWYWTLVSGWRYIVIHHSATSSGSAATFHEFHSKRGFSGGLAYHFVIGNGQGASDGGLEEGWRWTTQAAGAHVRSTLYNRRGIGIALVGNFENDTPTPRQWNTLVSLSAELSRTHSIDVDNIVGHRDVPDAATACPGVHLDISALREAVRQVRQQEPSTLQRSFAMFKSHLSRPESN